jgi:uncharacterized protein (DUF58 family)
LRLTARGTAFCVATALLLVAAYAVGSRELLTAALLVGSLVLVAVLTVLVRRPEVRVTRTFTPRTVAAGGSVAVEVHVGNRSLRPAAAGQWTDRMPWPPHDSPTRALPALVPRGTEGRRGAHASFTYVGTPPRRGVATVGPLRVEHSDPFRLVRDVVPVEGTDMLVVTPAVVELHDAGFGVADGEGAARLVQRSVLGGEDDLTTREYRRGDAMRRVHWRASARHGELMVRQEEQRAKPELRLLVDTRRSGYADALPPDEVDEASAQSETFEWTVRMVASLGVHLSHAGFLVHIVETAAPQIAPLERVGAWGGDDERFLASLAAIRLSEELGRVHGENAPPSSIFAVLADADRETLEWVVRQRRGGERATAFVPERAAGTRSVLEHSGWRCVPMGDRDDLATLWAGIATEATT